MDDFNKALAEVRAEIERLRAVWEEDYEEIEAIHADDPEEIESEERRFGAMCWALDSVTEGIDRIEAKRGEVTHG